MTTTHDMPTASVMLAKITTALDSGRKVWITVGSHHTPITPKVWRAWVAAGRPMLRTDGDHCLRMHTGRKGSTALLLNSESVRITIT